MDRKPVRSYYTVQIIYLLHDNSKEKGSYAQFEGESFASASKLADFLEEHARELIIMGWKIRQIIIFRTDYYSWIDEDMKHQKDEKIEVVRSCDFPY